MNPLRFQWWLDVGYPVIGFPLSALHFPFRFWSLVRDYVSQQPQPHQNIVQNTVSSISGILEYIHPAFIDCVLPAARRNYSTNIISGAVAGKICAIHNDIGHGQVRLILLKIYQKQKQNFSYNNPTQLTQIPRKIKGENFCVREISKNSNYYLFWYRLRLCRYLQPTQKFSSWIWSEGVRYLLWRNFIAIFPRVL